MGLTSLCQDENCIWKRKRNLPKYNQLGFKRKKWLAVPAKFKTRNAEDDDDNDAFCPCRKVAKSKNIMKRIFSCMTKLELLNCRLVSKQWNKLSSKTLQKSTTFDFREVHLRSSADWKTLDNLTSLLKNSKRFPCNKFRFYTTGKLLAEGRYEQILSVENEVFNNFLDVYGARIKKLTVYIRDVKRLHDFSQSAVYELLRGVVKKIPNRIQGCVSFNLTRGGGGMKVENWDAEVEEEEG